MNRRTFLQACVGVAVSAPPLVAGAETRVRRVGYLTPTASGAFARFADQFREALRERGYVEGESMMLELAAADNDLTRLPELAARLAASGVEVIVAASPYAILAAHRATRSIPIVMAFWGGEGLIESGMVASFARPGGNVTGIHMLADELEGKRLELLLQAVPKARRVGIMSTAPGDAPIPQHVQVAKAAGVELRMTPSPGPGGYAPVFEALARDRIGALLVPSFPRFFADHMKIIELAARYRIPAIYEWGDMARAGGLMAYGPVFAELQRSVASYVDRILKGARPAEMPIEQPSHFEVVINLKTAHALGLRIPESVMSRADKVIE